MAERNYISLENLKLYDTGRVSKVAAQVKTKAEASALAGYVQSEALGEYLTTQAAGETYAKKGDITDMLTKTEAGTTYAAKGEITDMLTKTEAGTTYALKADLTAKADSATVTAVDTRLQAVEGELTGLAEALEKLI